MYNIVENRRKNNINGYGDRKRIKDCTYRENNREKRNKANRIWRKNNLERKQKTNRAWCKNNKNKTREYRQNSRTAKLNARPVWLTKKQRSKIKQFYTKASKMEGDYHVDHIIPLQGKNVCGLHVPWNLQVIPAKKNISKGNKFSG